MERQRVGSARREAQSPRRNPSEAGGTPEDSSEGTLSKRKQKSALRLQEFQQRRRIFLLWRRVLHKIARSWRHERLWRVHNAWYATHSTSADSAEPPAPEAERMEKDRGTTRAVESVELEQLPHGLEGVQPSGGGMNPTAQEFVPGWQAAEVEPMQSKAAYGLEAMERRVARREVELCKELRRARKAKREAEEAAIAAKAATHNADATTRAAALRTSITRPLGISPRPPGC